MPRTQWPRGTIRRHAVSGQVNHQPINEHPEGGFQRGARPEVGFYDRAGQAEEHKDGDVVGAILISPLSTPFFAFGGEYGWRGFLLPKLLPLGQWPAHLIGGAMGSLARAPGAHGFQLPWPFRDRGSQDVPATTLLGVFESEWTLLYNSILLVPPIEPS
jgi:hypothetical protein